MSTHMAPTAFYATMVELRGPHDDLVYVDEDYYLESDWPGYDEERRSTGWFAHFSAPGYLDQTDAIGPFLNRSEALYELWAWDGDPDLSFDEWCEYYGVEVW